MSYTVPTTTLADGKVMPLLAWGNADVPNKGKDVTAITVASSVFRNGRLQHLDTAEGYNCSLETGTFLREFDPEGKEKLFVTSKVSTKDGAPEAGTVPLSDIRPKILALFEAYGGRQPDVLLVHNPYLTESITELWGVLDEMKDAGEITSSLGVSNYHPKHLEEVLRVAKHKPVVHQLEVHPYVLSHIQPILDTCQANKIAVTAFAPLTPFASHPTGGPAKAVLEQIGARIARETGKDVDGASALLLWLRTKGIGAILGSHNEERLDRYAATQTLRDLTEEEVAAVDEAGKKVYWRKWDEHMAESDFPTPDLPEDV